MILKQCRTISRFKTRRAVLQIPQDLKRATTLLMIALQIKRTAKIFGQYDHVRIYGRDFDKLRSIGLE
jgi:hypothetical protein